MLPEFVGEIDQVPPTFSAVKVGGRRAYERARRGKSVTLTARRVTVYRLQLTHWAYPDFELEICCGSGTYVRSLGRDIAERLGTKAVMTALTRSAIGPFELADAVAPDRLTTDNWRSFALPPRMAVQHLTAVRCDAEAARTLAHGRPLTLRNVQMLPAPSLQWAPEGWQAPADLYAVVDEHEQLLAIARRDEDLLRPRIVLTRPATDRTAQPSRRERAASNEPPSA